MANDEGHLLGPVVQRLQNAANLIMDGESVEAIAGSVNSARAFVEGFIAATPQLLATMALPRQGGLEPCWIYKQAKEGKLPEHVRLDGACAAGTCNHGKEPPDAER